MAILAVKTEGDMLLIPHTAVLFNTHQSRGFPLSTGNHSIKISALNKREVFNVRRQIINIHDIIGSGISQLQEVHGPQGHYYYYYYYYYYYRVLRG